MQSGHGKMDDRENKFIDSAFTVSTTCKNPLSHFYYPSSSSAKSSSTSSSSALPDNKFTSSKQVSFTSSLHNATMSESSPATTPPTIQFNQDEREREINETSSIFPIYEDEKANLSPSLSNKFSANNLFSSVTSSTSSTYFSSIIEDTSNTRSKIINTTSTATTYPTSNPIITSNNFNDGNYLEEDKESAGMDAGHLHHHRSRIKPNCISSSSEEDESPLEKQIETAGTLEGCRKSRRRGRRRRSSSTNSSSFTSTTTAAVSFSITTSKRNSTSTSSSSPSRFLLTFLSSCHLVQVTSRLVVALAMTSLFLVLVHVMPGAYCSSSTSIYSQAAAAASSSTTSITTGAQHHHATKRAYFNQSVLAQLKVHKAFQPLSSSSSSFIAGRSSESNGGGGVMGDHQRTWLKTRWPLTLKASKSTFEAKQIITNENDDNLHRIRNERGEGGGSGDDVVNVNNKLYSNQLGVNNLMSNNDYVDIQQPQNNIVVLRTNNYNDNNNQNGNRDNGGNLSAKNNLVTDKESVNKLDKSATIENSNNNYDYYNNGNNNNNNRSNYNYYDTSFVNVESTSSSNSQSTSLLMQTNKSNDNNKNYNDDSEKTVDNNTQQQPMNRGSNSIIYDNNDEEIINRHRQQNNQNSDDFGGITENERGDRASTAKVERTHSSSTNNGTTKAERDNISNVSSTGVRPTMAFTNSYFGRSSQQSFGGRRNHKDDLNHNSDFGGEEDEIYGMHDADDRYTDMIQSDQPSNLRHHFTREDNKDTSQLKRRGRLLSLKSDNDGDDDNEDTQGEIDNSSSGRRRKKPTWRDGESNARDEFLRLVSFTSSSSYRQQDKSSSSSSAGRPTAITATTTITDSVPATSKQGAGKFFGARKQSSATGSSDGDPSSGSLLLADDSTSSFLSSSPSSPSSSSSSSASLLSSKLKSIKYTSSFSSSSLSNNDEHHLIPSSSTATLHYLNENSSAGKVEGDSASSIVRKISSPTLSNHNHRFRQQQQQAEQEDERHYNEVFRFGDPPADEYEDEVIVDDNDVMEVENEDISEVGRREEISNDDSNKIPMQSTSSTKTTKNNDNLLLPSSSRESTNYLKQRTPNKSKLTNNKQQQSHHHHQVSPTIFGELNSSPADDGIVAELITKNKNEDGRDKQMVLTPTASATASKSVSSKRYPHSSQNGNTNFNNNNKPIVVDDMVEEVDQLMLGDDPSIIISRDNLFGGASRISSSSSTSSNPLNKNTNVSLSASYSASTTASTFGSGGGTKRNPLQIRRDLSRLVASGTGRGLNGGGNGVGSSLVGDDEEPMPNKCDRLFMWNGTTGSPNGTFESPTMISEEGHLYQCIFMFLPEQMQRVELVFTQFSVRGTPPECVHEWVDIWTEVEGTDPTDLVTTPFSGRYCGKIPPRRRISLYGGIAIGFYSDKNSTDETIFRGTYSFISNSPYQIGTPVPRTLCSYTIQGASKRNGDLISPTYPGVYPKNLSCSYKFIGIEGQRIRLEFRDFDVFYGGAHCPFDEVKVYDGMDPTAPLIGTYCGQQRNLVVFSSAHLMLVTFTTLERSTESQNRGFKGVWEFSESFVKLDFIEKNMGTHIRGTECDQRILSKGQSAGVVYSPNYPFPYVPKIVCRYFIYGLQDPQHLERVRLSFEKFDVITNINSEEDTANQSEPKKCGDGFLKVYLKGQEVIQAYDKADYEFCGKESPHDVVSDGPRLVLVFSSGETVGSGFKGRYQFETEYRVPGTAAPDGSCHFTYYSSSRMKGEFNSPRFPSNYPSMTNCTYIFFQQPNEQVRIVFDNFKMRSDKFNYTDRGAYADYCDEDWVEIWNVINDAEDRLVGRYCGSTAPGPIESREKASALKVILHTDDEGVSSGFKARYIYFTAKTIFGECGQNITQAQSGVLTSPKWPGKYDGPSKGEGSATCNWYLSVRPGSRVMLHFQNFAIEGEPNGRGCPAAAVRIWVDPDGVPVELCGESLMVENSQYVSARNLMRVTFITADKAVGAPGFRAVWTEVQDRSSGTPCHHSYFRCSKSSFCIPAELRCDGTDNCGTEEGENDMSDEEQCGLEFGDMNTVIAIIIGVAVSLFFIVLLCAWGQRRKRRRRRRLQLRRPPIHVCDNAGARFAAMDSV